MAVITLGSPSFDPTPLITTSAPTPGAAIKVVSGATSTAMTGESDPIFTAWDRSTGITIDSSQINVVATDIVPTGLALSSKGLNIALGSGQSAYIIITWNAISTSTFDHYNIRYKKTASTYYSYISSNTNTIEIGGLIPNTSYDFGVASVNKQGALSAFCTPLVETTTLDTTLPATVQTVSATAGIRSVKLEWDHNTELDLASYNIYRYTSNVSGSSSVIANSTTNYFTDIELTGGTIQWYWVKAKDTSGNLSAAYSVSVSATPRNVSTTDIVDAAITSLKTSLAAINPTDGEINANKVGTLQIDTDAVSSAKIQNDAIIAAKLNVAAIHPTTGALNVNTVGTTQIDTGAVTHALLANDAIEANNIATDAVTGPAIQASAITAGKIGAGEITATHILTGALTARHITSLNFVVSGTFTNNSPIAGKVAYSGCKVVYNGEEHTIVNGNCEVGDKHIYWELATPTVFLYSVALPSLTNNGFLVAFNNGGTYLLVWNSTIINGNRITTGSVTATQIGAGAIIAGKIDAGAIVAADIAAGTITGDKILSYNFQLITNNAFIADTPTTDQISWIECQVVYKGVTYTVAAGACGAADKYVYWQLSTPTVFSSSGTLLNISSDAFIVATNGNTYYGKGTPVYVWNATTIDGNRITTGSIVASLIAAGTITANEIAADTITAVQIAAGAITASEILAGTITGDKISAGTITADKITTSTLSAITANLGSVTAGSAVITTGADKIWLNDASDGALCIGGSTKTTAPFKVTSAGVVTATSVTITGKVNGLNGLTFEIGDWNMVSTPSVSVPHGLTNSKIRTVAAFIKSDDILTPLIFPIGWLDVATGVSNGNVYIGGSNIVLTRNAAGTFNSIDFDSTGYNRGWIIIQYEV